MFIERKDFFSQKVSWSWKVKRKNSWFNFKNSSEFIVSISIIKFPIALTWINFFGVLYVCSCARVCYFLFSIYISLLLLWSCLISIRFFLYCEIDFGNLDVVQINLTEAKKKNTKTMKTVFFIFNLSYAYVSN